MQPVQLIMRNYYKMHRDLSNQVDLHTIARVRVHIREYLPVFWETPDKKEFREEVVCVL